MLGKWRRPVILHETYIGDLSYTNARGENELLAVAIVFLSVDFLSCWALSIGQENPHYEVISFQRGGPVVY